MKKILTAIDVYLSASVPYVVVTTGLLAAMKLLSDVTYGWLAAFSPIWILIAAAGVTNFLIFILDKLDNGGNDETII